MLRQIIDTCRNLERIIIVGMGKVGKSAWEILNESGIEVTCFCDNNAQNCREVYGCKVFLPEEAVRAYPDANYIISISKYRTEVLKQLLGLGISEEKILHFYASGSDEYYSRIPETHYQEELEDLYRITMGRALDLANPQRFTEKIQWLKLYDRNPLKTMLADKYAVRDYIKEKIGEEHLIPLLGVWNRFEDINFDELPDTFVLKCNHGSEANAIIKNKSEMDKQQVEADMKKWLNTNYAFISLEPHYKNIPPKIIAEKYIEELDGNLYDYKVHCFHGEPTYIQVIGDRDIKAHTGLQLVYDFDWNEQDWICGPYPKYQKGLKRPSALEELYRLSRILCEEFQYVRTDFYIVSEHIFFGEMTFTPGSGMYRYGNYWTPESDLMLGEKIIL